MSSGNFVRSFLRQDIDWDLNFNLPVVFAAVCRLTAVPRFEKSTVVETNIATLR